MEGKSHLIKDRLEAGLIGGGQERARREGLPQHDDRQQDDQQFHAVPLSENGEILQYWNLDSSQNWIKVSSNKICNKDSSMSFLKRAKKNDEKG